MEARRDMEQLTKETPYWSQFDSGVFQQQVCKLTVDSNDDVLELQRLIATVGVDLVFVKVRAIEFVVPVCNSGHVGCIDGLYDSVKKIPAKGTELYVRNSIPRRPAEPSPFFNICDEAFRYVRFYRNPRTKDGARDLYHWWMRNAHVDRRVLYEYVDEKPAGFLIFTENKQAQTIRCDLIAVDKKLRGKKIGERLMARMEDRAPTGYRAWVKTSVDNLGALRFYQRLGYQIRDFETAIDLSPRS